MSQSQLQGDIITNSCPFAHHQGEQYPTSKSKWVEGPLEYGKRVKMVYKHNHVK